MMADISLLSIFQLQNLFEKTKKNILLLLNQEIMLEDLKH